MNFSHTKFSQLFSTHVLYQMMIFLDYSGTSE